MDLFTQIKIGVSVKEAAEYYGLEVNRGNMVCCPFHNDRTPSMKLNEDYFYCFGCGATGDVIDLVARLFNLSSYDAAKKLAYDFGINPDKPPAAVALRKPKYPLAKPSHRNTTSGRAFTRLIILPIRAVVPISAKSKDQHENRLQEDQSDGKSNPMSEGSGQLHAVHYADNKGSDPQQRDHTACKEISTVRTCKMHDKRGRK